MVLRWLFARAEALWRWISVAASASGLASNSENMPAQIAGMFV